MPPIHSSPHPFNDSNVDWNPPAEDRMSGNPYPSEGRRGHHSGEQFRPGYDAEQWKGYGTHERGGRRGGGGRSSPSGWGNDTGGWGSNERGRGGADNSWGGAALDNSWGAQGGGAPGWGNSGARGGPPPSGWGGHSEPRHHRGHTSRRAPSPEDAHGYYHHRPRQHEHNPPRWDTDDRDGFGFPVEDEEPFMPPPPSWDEPPFEDFEDDEVEDEWAREDRRDHEARFRRDREEGGGGYRESSPPPLLEMGEIPVHGRDRGHGHGHGHGHRRSRSRGHGHGQSHRHHREDSPNDGMPPLGGPHGGPPQRGNMKVRRVASAEHLPRRVHTYHNSSGSSFSSGSFGPAQPLQYGGAYPAAALRRSGTGLGLKKAMRWLSRPLGPSLTSVTLHPLLRPSSLLKSVTLHWDTMRPPLPVRGGIPIGAGSGFGEPATSPPTTYMRLLIPIPGLPDGHWAVNVYPVEIGGAPRHTPSMVLGSPYAYGSPFPGSPFGGMSPFLGSTPGFPYSSMQPQAPIVTTAAVLLALHRALQGRATEQEFLGLPEARRKRVAAAFWARCRKSSGGEQAAEAEIHYGVRRLDFLGLKTRWAGLTPALELDEWIVRLSRP